MEKLGVTYRGKLDTDFIDFECVQVEVSRFLWLKEKETFEDYREMKTLIQGRLVSFHPLCPIHPFCE